MLSSNRDRLEREPVRNPGVTTLERRLSGSTWRAHASSRAGPGSCPSTAPVKGRSVVRGRRCPHCRTYRGAQWSRALAELPPQPQGSTRSAGACRNGLSKPRPG
jgi:hypothetical protein